MGKGLGNDVESRRQFRTVQPDLDHTTFFKSSVPAVTRADRWVASLLKDPRDTRLVYLLALWTVMFVPTPVYFFGIRDSALSWAWWEFAWIAAHVGLCIHFSASYVAILHNHCHVALFKKNGPAAILNSTWLTWLVGPLFGQSPDTYYCHHIKMHHVTGNNPDDLSCTTWYERDNAWHFAQYFFRFYFLIIIELPIWFAKRGQYNYAVRGIAGEAIYWTVVYMLSKIDGFAAFLFFAVPHTVMRIGMMSGNWGQHAFVDPQNPDDDYKNSLTVINVRYNWIAFNDGYHTSHHLNALRHWADHPKQFVDNVDSYASRKTIVFEGLDFHGVFFALMFKNYKLLADRYVRLPGDTRTTEEVMAFLKSRTRPIPASAYKKQASSGSA